MEGYGHLWLVTTSRWISRDLCVQDKKGKVMNTHVRSAILLAALLVLSSRAIADELATQSQALTIIRNFAKDMCTTVPIESSSSGAKLTGEAKAKLTGIVNKLADLGVSGAAEYSSSASQGVLQADLTDALKDANSCRLHIFDALKDKLLQPSTTTPPKRKKLGLLLGTEISIGMQRQELDTQLARIGSQCNWSTDASGLPSCSFRTIYNELPIEVSLRFSGEVLQIVRLVSLTKWGIDTSTKWNGETKINGQIGSKSEVDKYCAESVLNQQTSALLGKWGQPLSPPQKSEENRSTATFKEECGGRVEGECEATSIFVLQKYVFRVDPSTLLQFHYEHSRSDSDRSTSRDRYNAVRIHKESKTCMYQFSFLTG